LKDGLLKDLEVSVNAPEQLSPALTRAYQRYPQVTDSDLTSPQQPSSKPPFDLA